MLRGKKGQVTMFIIIAILVVAIGVLIYFFYPKIQTTLPTETSNPYTFIQTCLEDKIEETVDIISLQGGNFEANEASSYYYKKNYVEYLCYTSQNYQPCVVQNPLLIQHIESEILNEISEDVASCFDALEESYNNKGYDVNLKRGETKVELLPKRIVTSFEHELTLTKGDSEKYDSFEIVLSNNIYELATIAGSLVEWEAEYGDAPTSNYMAYYSDLRIDKQTQVDGTRIYILTDLNNRNKFQFASRSYVRSNPYS